jgi:signal transduction histidine kinase/ligand-binding sensor domain-containing protein/AraC-like DNA-binding protein/AmiR/NasT family two-component response regulator
MPNFCTRNFVDALFMRHPVFVFIASVLGLTAAGAQPATPYFSTISVNDGLPSNVIAAVAEDDFKFIWIGTANGLARYDGYHFRTFRKGEPDNTIPSNQISSLLTVGEDLWVGSWNGLCRINTRTLEVTRVDLGAHKVVRVLHKDRDGNVWIGTATALLRHEAANGSFTAFTTYNSNLSHNTVRSIYHDSRGDLWVGTYDRLNKLQKGATTFSSFDLKGTYRPALKNNLICDIKPLSSDNDSILWVGTETGLCRFNTSDGNFIPYNEQNVGFSNEVIKAIYVSDDENVWLGTDFGLQVFQQGSQSSSSFFHNPQVSYSIASNVVWQIFEDSGGVIWFVTSNGVSKLNKFRSIFDYHEVSHKLGTQTIGNQVKAALVTRNGMIWLATLHGVLRIDPLKKTQRVFDTESPARERILLNNVFALEEDDWGRIWIGTAGGINVWNEKEQKMYAITTNTGNGLTSNYIAKFTRASDGSFWVSAWEGGIFRVDGNLQDPGSIRFQFMGDLGSEKTVAGHNAIWIVNDNELYKLDLALSKSEHVQSFHALSKRRDIHGLYHASDGKLWAGSLNGLIEYDPATDQATLHPINTGMQVNFGTLIEDLNGNIWATGNNAVIRFIVASSQFEIYPLDKNLPLKSFFNGCAARGHTGEIIFGGDNGYITLFPEKIVPNAYHPPVYVTDVVINNAESQQDDQGSTTYNPNLEEVLTLDYSQRAMTFSFASLHYWQPQTNLYAYKLEGFDGDWNYVSGENNFAVYSNLSPGDYTFRVKGTNNNGVWSDQPAVMKLHIKAPLFLRMPFIIAYVALALVAIWLGLTAYSARLHLRNELKIIKMEKEHDEEIARTKQQFFTNISHELRTPISLILPPIRQTLKRGDLDDESKRLMGLAEKNSRRLLRLVDQILDFRSLENGTVPLRVTSFDFVPFTHDIYNLFTDLAARNDIDFTFHSAVTECKLWADSEKLETIFFNLLSNAFKFTPGGGTIGVGIERIAPSYSYPNGAVQAHVRDSGIGIPYDEQAKIFERFYQTAVGRQLNSGYGIGLTLAWEYARLHHGELTVSSEPGKGTSFTVVLPLGSSHFPVDAFTENAEVNLMATKSGQPGEKHHYRFGLDVGRPTVLLVENNPDVVDFVRISLGDKYNFIIAENGEEGLARATRFSPAVVVSDIMMPVMDGLTLCRRIKEDPKTSHIPIILLTARKLDENKVEGIRMGADSYLTKPFDIELLDAHIDHLIRRTEEMKAYFRNELVLVSDPPANNSEEVFIGKVMNIIEANISNPDFGVEILCKDIGMSATHLYRKLKATTHLSANEIIKKYRIKKASLLLRNKQGNISEIMYSVGFSNLSYFSKCFKKEYGVAPKDYQARMHVNEIEINQKLEFRLGKDLN